MTARIRLNETNRRWWTLAAMCFALFMVMLDNTVVNVALPSIQRDLHATVSGLEWTVNAYTLAFAVLLVTGGRLGDLFGRRRMFLFGVVTFALSSALHRLRAERGVAGRRARGPGPRRRVHDARHPLDHLQRVPARTSAARRSARGPASARMALAIGPVVGGFLVENVSWQSIFFLNLPVAAGAVVVTLFATHESRDETAPPSVDIPGVAAISVGLAALVLALVEANAWGWGSARIVGLFAVAAAGAGRLRAGRDALALPDGRLQLLPLAVVPGRERRRVHRQLRDARDVLLPRALHAEHQGLLAAAGRRALPALDRRDHRRRADRGAPDRPHRTAPADDARAADGVRLAVLAGPPDGRHALQHAGRRVRADGHWAWASSCRR